LGIAALIPENLLERNMEYCAIFYMALQLNINLSNRFIKFNLLNYKFNTMINSLLSQVVLQKLLVEWNRTATDYPRHLCIHQVFEVQVAQTPDAVAVVFEDLQMTYGELNRRANQLACRLRSLGVGPEVLVGMSVERSVDMIVGLLGILKAGGAYLPLDPTYPLARLRWLLEDAQVSVLLTQVKFVELVQSLHGNFLTSVVCLDTDREIIDPESEANLVNQTSPENLAYVMYTSGSTGQPKGVSVVHRGVVRLVKNTNYLEFSADQVFLQLSTIAFDASTFEIWGALLNGAKLAVMPPQVPSLAELGQALRRYQVTTVLITTGLFHQMIDERLEDLQGLRYLMTGGEVLSPRHAKKVLENLKSCQFINAYGPTENTTITTCGLINDLRQIGDTVPIGRPIANTQVYVLNAQMQPVPVGEEGELYIGGEGLARGYFKRPTLTAEKFVPNPFSEDQNERLYKTGDLVRYLPDGQLDFRGRVDYQVKLRGFRIEPGEIEATLQQFPAVRQALVMVHEVSPQDKRLVAYVVLTKEAERPAEETIQALRHWLGERLPKYMSPSAIVPLAEFPVTPQGKVDRRALPIPSWNIQRELAEEDLPRTVIEQQLLALWSVVLNVAPLSIHDNFFEVGGHSLLATQLVARICETFQVDLPLRSLFNYPTVSTLASHLPAKASSPPVVPAGLEASAGPSVYQASWWLFEQIHPATPTYHIALAFEVKGPLNIAVLEQALTELARHHTALRTSFEIDDAGKPQQRIAVPSPCPVTVMEMRNLSEIDMLAHLKAEARRPFELVKDRLWRVAVYRLEEQQQILLLTFHHLIIDGWSMGLVFQELTELYAALEAGRPCPLPAPAYQYVDFCHWQQQWLQGEEFQTQLAYWQARLSPLPPVLELPSDYPRPPVQTYEGARQPIVISPSLTVAIRTLGHQQGVTLFMVLLAAFQVLLYRYTGQTDLSVGTAVAGRQRVAWEKVIGLFINNLVLRTDLSQQPSVVSLLQQVREVALGAYSHQELPFQILVEKLQKERDFSHTPLFQAFFLLQNFEFPPLKLSGLTTATVALDIGTAKVDLCLELYEQEDNSLTGWLEYNSALFSPARMQRMVGHLQTLLESMVAHPQQSIATLPWLTEMEKQQLLVEWQTPLPLTLSSAGRDDARGWESWNNEDSIPELFTAQAIRTPYAIAVIYGNQHLTYQQLNQRANQLAHYLRQLGVGPAICVGLSLERSLEMVVGLLGILKAGGAYVPLDPHYPQERLAMMVADAQIAVLVTHSTLRTQVPSKVQRVEVDNEEIAGYSPDNLHSGVTANQLAYVIYTSGSTGVPKGVMIEHGAWTSFCQTVIPIYGLTAQDRVLQFANLSFDAAVEEIYPCLLTGATLVLRTPEMIDSPSHFWQCCQAWGVTVLDLPTAYWHELVNEIQATTVPPGVRLVILGGEAAQVNRLATWQRFVSPQVRLVNTYGPTEATVVATWGEMTTLEPQNGIPIGRVLPGTSAYVLDANLQLVPVGVPGELHLGGSRLARGYLNQSTLTAEKFIADPFSSKLGSRLYKTGDLVCYRASGQLEFLGRIDKQVKVRGFRIELGEIESCLNQHPKVAQSVLVLREDEVGNKRLVAYVVPRR
jgi:amino acid adenylation domain-containing protein